VVIGGSWSCFCCVCARVRLAPGRDTTAGCTPGALAMGQVGPASYTACCVGREEPGLLGVAVFIE
jgi:hypothetical protein